MEKVLVSQGLSVGGWIGRAVGARFGFFAAFLPCVVATALGLYAGRRIARHHF